MPRATNDPLTPPKATTVAPPAAAAKAGGDAPQRSSAAAASGSGEVGYVHSQYEPSRQLVLEQHQRFQRNVLNARENASGSRAASNYQTPAYVARQKEYMQWFGAKSGFLRGVALREKKPLPFPVVTRSWAAVFLEEVYCNINSHMKSPDERDALQEEFYKWHENIGTGARDSPAVIGWTPIRAFLDQVLRKRKPGFAARSIEMKKRRKVGVESAAAAASNAGAGDNV